MTCEEAWILISGHLDHENTQAEEAQLREHLEHCAQCRQWMDAMECCDHVIRASAAEPPDALFTNVMAAVQREKPRKHRSWIRWAGGAAAAAVLLAVGLRSLPQKQEEEAPNLMVSRVALDCAEGAEVTDDQIQELADDRIAGIVMLEKAVPELNTCDVEELPNGSVLYALQDQQSAQTLCEQYQLGWYEPMNSAPEQYYALLLP